ncbi:unnamed protein product [Paramecium pentaurelia]|uniref:Uncharacterized protein n=1 Tax=Paramecium pentaurelia TaxID=43138 RepID=A0A8S1XGK4_9CILI|nr:unnamed protein product [Paramecium pentaurelia]
MSEQHLQENKFTYSSNLVIQRESGPRTDEPTGEPESLVGKINPRMMGTKAVKDKPVKSKKEQSLNLGKQVNMEIEEGVGMPTYENLLYIPKTKDNRLHYERLLSIVYGLFQEQSQDVIKSIVDEVLAIMKNDNLKDSEKRQEVEAIIGKLTNELFSDIVLSGKAITDYNPEITQGNTDEMQLPLNLEEEQDSSDMEEIIEEEDDSQEQNEQTIKAKVQVEETRNKVVDIDGFWLQRELQKIYQDPIVAQQMEQTVLDILKLQTDIECENQLVLLFGQDRFDLIRLLHANRHKIFYCTLLSKAQSAEQVEQIHSQMRQTQEGLQILMELQKKKKNDAQFQIIQEENEKQYYESINITDQDLQGLSKKIVDLEQLQFVSQGHLMSNEKCHLPPHSFKVTKKGYEEIYIPAPKPNVHKDNLIQIGELPEFAQQAFRGFKELNTIQSVVYEKALLSNENMLICAPTGAGKTNIALLTMLQTIGEYYQNGIVDIQKFKIIYIAPMKALVNEMVHNFQNRLEPYNIKVAEVTGDTHLTKHQLNTIQVLIATPEKWDILTRKIQQNDFISLVRLVIIDEIHLLHDSRGPVIESIIARQLKLMEERQEVVRIVGLSATLPNYSDVATFIRVKQSGVFFFDNSYRPVPLQQQYIGINEKKPIRRMLLTNEILYEKVIERITKSQILVFVHSRKETVKTAKTLKEMAFSKDELSKFIREESSSKKILETVIDKEDIKSADLKELLASGIAIHHAGLCRGDRDLVESLFEKKNIQILISTSTLAWGVNLPAHTVIIKGTQIYSPEQGKWIELSPQDILQMMGRAGRPRYDTSGEGIILTTYQELKYYLSLLNVQLPIESQFVSQLADQLNAEVAQGNIKNLKDGVNWLGYTYLYVRMLRNPQLYNIPDYSNDQALIKYRADLIHSACLLLDKNSLAIYDKKTGNIESTILGKIASNYYIKYPSMQVYNQHLKQNMGMIDIFKVFSLSHEFKLIPIREEEKIELQKLMMSVPVPIKGSPEDSTTKINVLLQGYISRLKLEGYALNSDMVYIMQSAGRIMRALYEICLQKEWAQSALQCLQLSKMIEKRMWSCMTPLRQFKGLPDDLLRRIEKKEGITWEHLYAMSSQQLGELIRYQNQNMTKLIHKYIHKFPKIEIQAFAQPITRSCLRIDLHLSCDFQWDEKIHGRQEPFHIFVLDSDGEKILYHEMFLMKQKNQEMEFTLTVALFEVMHPIYYIKVISDKWISCESEQPIPFKNLILPEPFNRCTDLLQLTLLSIDQIKHQQIENILAKKILQNRYFDQIQTQVFQQIYQSNDNIFIGSSTYQSKSILPILAILQMTNIQKGYKAIYVSSIQTNCDIKYNQFLQIFNKTMSLKIGKLSGQTQSDNKILEQCDIIVSNAINWDIISRRWRAKKGFKDIRVFIADDLHTLGQSGSVLEVIVSRMRMISMEIPFRVVGLSLSVADYKEMSDWIGSKHTFNFQPIVRPNNIQIQIQSFDQCQRPLRIQAMIKSLKTNLSNTDLNIIYVSDRKLARVCALELMINNNNSLSGFTIKEDQYLQHTLQASVGFLYECMDPQDESEVLRFISSGELRVVVVTYKLALYYNLKGKVFILDNQKYDGIDKRYVDYTIAEMLEMIESTTSQCHILTYSPKKEYYQKFLYEPMPIESHLNHNLANHLNAEIVAKNIHNTQDCIDWITWTFMYRRLTQNPNYYSLHEINGVAINNYLSELIETTIDELHESKCIAVEEDNELEAINSGIIANYYYINIETVKNFSDKINANSKLRDLLFILSEAKEFEVLNIRNGEEILLAQLLQKIPFQPINVKLNEPNTKALILLQAYFSRIKLNSDLKSDLTILELAIRLSTAMVDIASSNLWLKPAIISMQICQMIVQSLWKDEDSVLLQLPHFNKNTIEQLKSMKVSDWADFFDMDESDRTQVLNQFTQQQIDDIAQAGNRLPSVEISDIIAEEEIVQGDIFHVQVVLSRQDNIYTDYVIAPHYPKQKEEQWWVLCADRNTNRLFGNKKVSFQQSIKVDLRFQAPEAGDYDLTIYAICDSYIGVDTTSQFQLKVNPIIEQEQEQ